MKSRSNLMHAFVILIALLPLFYLAFAWNRIPAVVNIHYNAHFTPDKTAGKSSLWYIIGSMSLISLAVYFLLINIYRIDPKRNLAGHSMTFNRLGTGMVIFLTLLNFIILVASYKGPGIVAKLTLPLLGLLFAFIGNYMNNLKPNYFAGIRLPWTLSSDDNWKKTHRLAGRLWFWGGIILASLSFFLPPGVSFWALTATVIPLVTIPTIYSYNLFRHDRTGKNENY